CAFGVGEDGIGSSWATNTAGACSTPATCASGTAEGAIGAGGTAASGSTPPRPIVGTAGNGAGGTVSVGMRRASSSRSSGSATAVVRAPSGSGGGVLCPAFVVGSVVASAGNGDAVGSSALDGCSGGASLDTAGFSACAVGIGEDGVG